MPMLLNVFRGAAPIVCAVFLTACDSPSVAFIGSEKTIVVIEDSTFSVHRREDQVEVYRTSFEMLPPREQVLARAELAIEQATGCAVKTGSLHGDQALIKASLACNGQPQQAPIPANLRYECQINEGWDIPTTAPVVEAIECDLVQI